MKHIFRTSKIKSYLKEVKLALALSFSIGFLIPTIPYIYKYIANIRIEKLNKEERAMQIKEKEKQCKSKNSDYTKFVNLGFPDTANEKFQICMREQ